MVFMFIVPVVLLIKIFGINGESSSLHSNDIEVTTQIPQISPLLTKMLQSSGFGAELPARQVAANFTLNFEDILKLAKMADIDEFNKLLKPILIPRIVESQGHKQVEEFIKTTLTSMNFHTEVDEFVDKTPNGPKTFRNIIGTYSLEAERRLLLACHYDSKILEGEKFLGATDSAVPCALILALAKKLEPFLKKQQNPRITLQLVFFDGEEAFGNWTNTDSLYGSRHLAKVWSQKQWEIDRINAFMLLDLLGAKNPQIAHQIGHGTKPLFDKIVEIERQLNESGHLQKAEKVFHSFEIQGPIEDDHRPFSKKRVPIMHLISFVFPDEWHTVEDNEKILDMNTIHNLLSVLLAFVADYLGVKP